MEETGRRAKHITAWRGPCTVVERLSQTAYAVTEDLLPYRAVSAKPNADAAYNQTYSEPFAVGEFLALRDEPTGPFYVARVDSLVDQTVTVHYYGCTGIVRNSVGDRHLQAMLAQGRGRRNCLKLGLRRWS